jgi:hypothetical protein
MMDNGDLGIEATKKTPSVRFMPNGELSIKGRSIPEDGSLFYVDIVDWIADYTKNPSLSTVLTIELEYLNDITSKYLLRIVTLLKQACAQFTVKWKYQNGDEDMLELGQIMSSSSKASFEYIEIV